MVVNYFSIMTVAMHIMTVTMHIMTVTKHIMIVAVHIMIVAVHIMTAVKQGGNFTTLALMPCERVLTLRRRWPLCACQSAPPSLRNRT